MRSGRMFHMLFSPRSGGSQCSARKGEHVCTNKEKEVRFSPTFGSASGCIASIHWWDAHLCHDVAPLS